MKIVMDADCLIKLTKAQLKEAVCQACDVLVPSTVLGEVLRNASAHPECEVIQANLGDGKLVEAKTLRSHAKGEHAALEVFDPDKHSGIASDDKRFVRELRLKGIPYITAGVFIPMLVQRGQLSVDDADRRLGLLAPTISEDEAALIRRRLNSLQRET
jgi:rRNA-processing protein FCF1